MNKTLKKLLVSKSTTVGTWVTLYSNEYAELMGGFDFDWLTIDMEHSCMSLGNIQQLVRTIRGKNKPVLVRVDQNNPNTIKRVMDTGPDGVIVPMVKTKEDAERAVASVKYPPKGFRGVGYARAQGYGLSFNEYKQWLAKESIVIAIIEHIDAIENLEEILSVEGIDASMIGPYDLSGSLGYPGEFDRPDVKKLLNKYLKVCKKLNKPAGYHVVNPDLKELNRKKKEGFQFLAFGTDALFFSQGVKDQMGKMCGLKE